MKVRVYGVRPAKMWFPIFSWLIRWVQNTTYSHMCFETEVIPAIADITSKGVHLTPTKQFFDHYEKCVEWVIDLPISQMQFWSFYKRYIAADYAYWQNAGYLMRALGLMKCNVLGDDERKLVCSEFCALFVREGGINIGDSDNYDLVQAAKLFDSICIARLKLK